MTWSIVSDSSCDLRMSAFEGGCVRFETVPLRIQVGEQDFIDNDDLVIPDLLDAMAEEKSASSTACPSPGAFAKAFEVTDRTICFTISGNLSGTLARRAGHFLRNLARAIATRAIDCATTARPAPNTSAATA